MEVIPEQWRSSFPAKDGRFRRRRGGWRKRKKDIEYQVHTWVRGKGKKKYIRRGKTEGGAIGIRWREKLKEKNHIFRACPKGIEEEIPRSYLSPFFTLKPNILAQDQTSSLSCTLQIHCLGYVGLDPFLFWIQVNSGPYRNNYFWGLKISGYACLKELI